MVERFYNLLLLLTGPLWGLWLVWRLVGQRKDRRAFNQRWLGLSVDALPADAAARLPRIWIHAVSVGEVMAVVPLVKALRRDHPRALLVGSTVTDLGQETMKAKSSELDAIFYLPYDLGWSVRRTLDSIRPSLFLFAETELWPNLLLALGRRGVPAVMINGRVSERSVQRYGWVGPFIRRVVQSLEALTVQTEADRERFIRLGADTGRVTVCGNLKADGAIAQAVDSDVLRRALGLGELGAERLIVMGSTHDPEERLAVQAFIELAVEDSGLRLCIAPRHLNRCEAIDTELRGMGVTVVRRSRLPASGRTWTNAREIVLLDTMGELAAGYELASVVIMGGTFAPIGGHNLLEPAAAGRAVVFGPHVGQWKAIAEELAACGAVGVQDQAGLVRALRGLLADDEARRAIGEAARAYVRSQQGATDRTMTVVSRVLEHGARSSPGSPRMVERMAGVSDWLWQGGLLRDAVKMVLAPVAWLYGALMTIRRTWYRRGWLTVERLPARVVSVGNVTVGGSGKTPVVMAIAELIASTGCPVGVVTRGYRGVRSEDPLLVSDGRSIRATVEEAGDEAMLMARRLGRVPVAVGRNRAEACRLLLNQSLSGQPKPEVLIVDDGFQHLRLHRDVNLLVVDGGRPGLEQRLLPCGPLRESWSAVRDATAVIIVDRSESAAGVDGRGPLRDRLKGRGFEGSLFLARLRVSGLTAVPSGDPLPAATLAGAAVAICSGIGHPESFRHVVAQAGGRVVCEWVYDDHHRYTVQDVTAMTREARRLGATALVTTEKDAVKLDWIQGDLPVVAVCVAMAIEPAAEWGRWLAGQGLLLEPGLPSVYQMSRSKPEQQAALLCGAPDWLVSRLAWPDASGGSVS